MSRLGGSRSREQQQDADPTEIRHRLDTHGLPRLRQALDLASLPVTIEFRFTTKTGARAL